MPTMADLIFIPWDNSSRKVARQSRVVRVVDRVFRVLVVFSGLTLLMPLNEQIFHETRECKLQEITQ